MMSRHFSDEGVDVISALTETAAASTTLADPMSCATTAVTESYRAVDPV